jgi:hypothetical protein
MAEMIETIARPLTLRVNGVSVTPTVAAAGIDFGFSDPLAIEVGAKIGSVWLNFYEVYETRLGIAEALRVCLGVARRFRIDRFWADSEDPKMIEYLQSHGIPVVPNQIKSLEFGVQTVYALMKQTVESSPLGPGPRFRVDPRACPNLVREIGLYGYAAARGELKTARPVDKHNHALDAVRYYVTGEGEIPPEVYSPEQQHRHIGMYTKKGAWYDDPVGYQLARARANRIEPGDWWDEKMGSMLDAEDEIIGLDYGDA